MTNEDINPIAMSWLESGLGGCAIACLASYHPSNISEVEGDLISAFEELKINSEMTTKQQVYQAVRHYLRLINQGVLDEYDGCAKIVNIETIYDPEIKLFKRPDCDAHFEERAKKYKFPGRVFAGQYFGIENLVGLYFSSDNYDTWTKELDMKRRTKISKDVIALLKTFYKDEYLEDNISK